MKAYLKIIPYTGIAVGLLSLLSLLLAFNNYNACQLANNHIALIGSQAKKGLETATLAKAKYHAYKALNHLEKTKTSLADCGCQAALDSALNTEVYLKKSTKADSLEVSKTHLKQALQNSLATLAQLADFDADKQEKNPDMVALQAKTVTDGQEDTALVSTQQMQEQMEKSLGEFKTSLAAVVKEVNCKDASTFIEGIIKKSDRKLALSTLSASQKDYHTKAKSIAEAALAELQVCE